MGVFSWARYPCRGDPTDGPRQSQAETVTFPGTQQTVLGVQGCKATGVLHLARTRIPLGPYRRPLPRVLGGWAFSYRRGTPVPCHGLAQDRPASGHPVVIGSSLRTRHTFIRWSYWLGIGAIGLVDQSTCAESSDRGGARLPCADAELSTSSEGVQSHSAECL